MARTLWRCAPALSGRRKLPDMARATNVSSRLLRQALASAMRRGIFIQPLRTLCLAPNVQVLLYRHQIIKQV